MKKAILLSKFQSSWEQFLIKKLSCEFDLDVYYFNKILPSKGISGSITYINKLIEKDVEVLFLDVEFYPCMK